MPYGWCVCVYIVPGVYFCVYVSHKCRTCKCYTVGIRELHPPLQLSSLLYVPPSEEL